MTARFWNKNKIAVEKYPIIPAKKLIPTWFKNLPSTLEYYNNISTIKSCPGIVNILTTGFIIRTWVDTIIESTYSSVKFIYPSEQPHDGYLTVMNPMLFNTDIKEYKPDMHPHVVKWSLGWNCKAPKGYNVLFLPAQYHPNLNFTTAIGISDTRVDEALHIQVIWHPEKGSVLIPAGTPIAQIILIKRDDVTDFTINHVTNADTYREHLKQERRYVKKVSYLNEEYFDDSIDEEFTDE